MKLAINKILLTASLGLVVAFAPHHVSAADNGCTQAKQAQNAPQQASGAPQSLINESQQASGAPQSLINESQLASGAPQTAGVQNPMDCK